jgi:hypothetical protein
MVVRLKNLKVSGIPLISIASPYFYLDAGNEASYPGSGSTWYDVSGNGQDFTLVDSPTYDIDGGGSLVFDGSTQYGFSPLIGTFLQENSTYEAWLKPAGLSSWQTVFDFDNLDYLMGFYNNTMRIYWYGFASGNVVVDDTWQHCVWVLNNNGAGTTTGNFYVNGSSVYSSSSSSDTNQSFTNFVLCAGLDGIDPPTDGPNELFYGKVALARAYNFSLSAAEVLQNYNVTKARFGY